MPSIPPIEEAWTAVLFSKDTRGTNHLETRRGYLPSEKCKPSSRPLLRASSADWLTRSGRAPCVPVADYSMHDATSAEAIHERMNQFLPECREFVRNS